MPSSSLPKLKKLVANPEVLSEEGITQTCQNCELGKSKASPYRAAGQQSKEIMELIHSNLSGKITVPSLGNFQYYITFIDDFSRMAFLYFLHTKDDALKACLLYTSPSPRD